MPLSEMTGLEAVEEFINNGYCQNRPEVLVMIAEHFGGRLAELSPRSKAVMRQSLFDQRSEVFDDEILMKHFQEAREACRA